MPATAGPNRGLQLWINLAAKDKMIPADYQELRAQDVPVAEEGGVSVRVIAGSSLGKSSPGLCHVVIY
jgi:redox-sensitive bicupin YhaK (pirin superfamily)